MALMNRVCVWISYGMGGGALDPPAGIRQLVARCKAAGMNTMASPYAWSDINRIAHEVETASNDVKIAVIGDSLGANEAPQIARMVKRDIDLLGGFQASEYGAGVIDMPGLGGGVILVPRNVVKAVEIYNPIWVETFGLGDVTWKAEPGNTRTIVRNVAIEAPHPGDFGLGQDVMFSYLKRLQQ